MKARDVVGWTIVEVQQRRGYDDAGLPFVDVEYLVLQKGNKQRRIWFSTVELPGDFATEVNVGPARVHNGQEGTE